MQPANKAPVNLLPLSEGTVVEIVRYDCQQEEVDRFAVSFQVVWGRLPETVRTLLAAHWSVHRLDVILTALPAPWGRKGGFASAKPDGCGVYFWSEVLRDIPEEHLQTDIAHELAHIVFILSGEPGHTRPGYVKAEWLITELLPQWGYDQVASDEWKFRNLDLDGATPSWIDPARGGRTLSDMMDKYREALQLRSKDRAHYCEEQKQYFDFAVGKAQKPPLK